jgi:hypothetical protein
VTGLNRSGFHGSCRKSPSIEASYRYDITTYGSTSAGSALTHPIRAGKFGGKPCHLNLTLHNLHNRLSSHQSNPCRGSSIGRACGSYDSKEINLKVVGSSPTFGYSYIKALRACCSFAFLVWDVDGEGGGFACSIALGHGIQRVQVRSIILQYV